MQPNKAIHGETVVKRVSRRHEEEAHGGAWKVAFADFCLALLCLFLVLWLLAARNTEELQQVLRNNGAKMLGEGSGHESAMNPGRDGSLIERYPVPASETERGGLGPAQNAKGQARRVETVTELNALAEQIRKASAEEGLTENLRTDVAPQGLRLMLHDTDERGMFERGSTVPSPRFQRLLRRLGPLFAHVGNPLLLSGHTDAAPYNDKSPGAFSNAALSTHRAMSARSLLIEGGMPQERILQLAGMADAALLDPAHPLASDNRRIEIMVLTSEQAQVYAALFGPPRARTQFAEGLSGENPEASRQLQRSLAPSPSTQEGAR